jgi:hypothetical protein
VNREPALALPGSARANHYKFMRSERVGAVQADHPPQTADGRSQQVRQIVGQDNRDISRHWPDDVDSGEEFLQVSGIRLARFVVTADATETRLKVPDPIGYGIHSNLITTPKGVPAGCTPLKVPPRSDLGKILIVQVISGFVLRVKCFIHSKVEIPQAGHADTLLPGWAWFDHVFGD